MCLLCRDTAGQERFRTITTAYYRGAMVSCIVSLSDDTLAEIISGNGVGEMMYVLLHKPTRTTPHIVVNAVYTWKIRCAHYSTLAAFASPSYKHTVSMLVFVNLIGPSYLWPKSFYFAPTQHDSSPVDDVSSQFRFIDIVLINNKWLSHSGYMSCIFSLELIFSSVSVDQIDLRSTALILGYCVFLCLLLYDLCRASC